jgi:hypothetical protein
LLPWHHLLNLLPPAPQPSATFVSTFCRLRLNLLPPASQPSAACVSTFCRLRFNLLPQPAAAQQLALRRGAGLLL